MKITTALAPSVSEPAININFCDLNQTTTVYYFFIHASVVVDIHNLIARKVSESAIKPTSTYPKCRRVTHMSL